MTKAGFRNYILGKVIEILSSVAVRLTSVSWCVNVTTRRCSRLVRRGFSVLRALHRRYGGGPIPVALNRLFSGGLGNEFH